MIISEQTTARQKFIGASDASTTIGVTPYRTTSYDLWLDKTGQAEPFAGNEATYWGNLLEAPVAQRLSEDNGIRKRQTVLIQNSLRINHLILPTQFKTNIGNILIAMELNAIVAMRYKH